jgi:hypothetical protein
MVYQVHHKKKIVKVFISRNHDGVSNIVLILHISEFPIFLLAFNFQMKEMAVMKEVAPDDYLLKVSDFSLM